ncbi:MAG: hypothetical protein FJX46_15605 [Alphaproteobacteria bacterium]|nr:hypothetical protein [Alphaproteobacteria bacterium]
MRRFFLAVAAFGLFGCEEMGDALSSVSSVVSEVAGGIGEVTGGPASQAAILIRPLNAKLTDTLDRVKKEYPDRKGMVVATFACYVPGEIDATSLRGDENCQEIANSNASVTGGKKMLAVIPLALKQDNQGRRAFIGEVKPNALIELVTIDYKQRDSLKQVYLLGDPQFDMVYIGKLAASAVIATYMAASMRGDDPFTQIQRVGAMASAASAVAFVTNLTSVMSEMARAGGAQGSDFMARLNEALAKTS